MKLAQSLDVSSLTVPWTPRPPGDTAPASPVRSLVVPPGIVAVPRSSPIPVRKKTPCRKDADGARVIAQTGGREWFADRLFVESKQPHLSAACSTSAAFHVGCAIVIAALLLMGAAAPPEPVQMAVTLRMPSMLALLPAPAAAPAATPTAEPRVPPPARAAAVPVEVKPIAAEPMALSVETPAAVEPVSTVAALEPGVPGGVEGGVGDGSGGIAGTGLSGAAGVPAAAGPVRVGGDIQRPRKIKDVKPVYPRLALASEVRGAVIVDLVVGPDGKVSDATIRQSIPALDQAALDAVRQWVFEPARRNGEAIAVIVTAVVSFAIL
jgi:protein TonB